MSSKKVRYIEPPKTNDKAEQLRYLAQLRGEVEEEAPKLNVKKFLIASLIIIVILVAGLIFCNIMLARIEEYNIGVELGTISGTVDDSVSYYLVGRLAAIVLLVVWGFVMLVKLAKPKRRKPNRSFWGDLGIYILMAIMGAAMAFPLVFSIASSLKPLDELFRYPPRVFPSHVTFDNFSDLIVTMGQSWVPFSRYLTNTVFITLVGTFGHVVIASMAAFVLAKYDFPGSKTFFAVVVTALMFSGYVTGIPNYVIMSKIGIIDTYWAIILPAFAAPIGLFLMKQTMESLPTALIEAAHIDGAGEFRIFWSIVMPNVKPAWLTIIIFSVQNLWNTNAATVIYSEAKKTLVYALQQIQAGGIARTGQAAAVTVIVMLVPITIFICSQNMILETMASSGLKD